jgi:quercetin dioxygenase-like cupin family protein
MVKLIGDTLNTKVMLVTFPPGVTTEMHTHPLSMTYVIEGGTLKVEYEGGKTETETLTAGQSVQLPPEPKHKTTNTGTTPVKIVLIEILK